jgi:F-type H+-transporting ATPase subunit c
MLKKSAIALAVVAFVFCAWVQAIASDNADAGKVQVARENSVNYFVATVLAAGLAMGIAAGMCGIAQGAAVAKALEGISRQPETASKIQMTLMIGLAFIESLALYVLFIGIILLFVNPFAKFFVQ